MSSIPGNQYFDFEANGWRPGSFEEWAQNNQINQETGELEGDYPLPPHEVARGYQAMHDRAVWNYRRRLMDQGRANIADGTKFNQGALGLLQSYRSGGSAALESGIYNQVAQGKRAEGAAAFQQASMTEPLDLLSDLRRHDDAVAQQRANRANERQSIAQFVSGASNTAGQAGAGSFAGMSGGGGGSSGGGYGGGGYGGGGASGGVSSGGQTLAAGLEPEMPSDQAQSPLASGGQSAGQQQGQQQGSPFAGVGAGTGQGANGDLDGGLAMKKTDPFGQQGAGAGVGAGQGGAGASQQGAGPGGGVGAGMAGGGALVAPGSDGNFSPDSFAAASAASSVGSPFGVMARVSLNHFLVDLYESDNFYQSLPSAIQTSWNKRLKGDVA